MSYPLPAPITPQAPAAASQPPPLPRSSRRRRFAMRTFVRMTGWLLVAALVVVSGIMLVSMNQQNEAHSADFRRHTIEAPVVQAHSLKALPEDEPAEEAPARPASASKQKTAEKAPPPAGKTKPASKLVSLSTQASKETMDAIAGVVTQASGAAALPVPAEQEVKALDAWPRSVALTSTPEVRTVSENPAQNEFIYHTEHFEFSCDAPIGPDAVRHFARVFEATWMLNCQLPLDLKPAPETMRKWFRARILSTDDAYVASGAPPGSGGYYSRADKTIYVPISNLGMKLVAGKRVQMERSVESNDTLIHEITHQMMSRWLPRLPVWFSEGSAEYTGMADFVHGRFFLSSMEVRLKEVLRRRGAAQKNGKTQLSMLSVPELLAFQHNDWVNVIGGSSGNENYTSALLLTYYFYHMDRDKKAGGVIAWLRDIEKGVSTADALRTHLLAGRTAAKLETDLVSAYRQAGIEIEIVRRGGEVSPD